MALISKISVIFLWNGKNVKKQRKKVYSDTSGSALKYKKWSLEWRKYTDGLVYQGRRI